MNISLVKAPLHPSQAAIDGYLLVLCDLFEKIDEHRHATLTSSDSESLHQLRITIRQARSILREGRKVLPENLSHAMADDLSWLSAITCNARDLDTLIEEWPKYERMVESKDVNQIQVVIRELHHRRKETYREMRAQLNGQRAIALINEWQVLMLDGTDFGSCGASAHEPLRDAVAERISRAHRALVRDCRKIDARSSDDEIHAIRKDAKRIRYLVESFSEILTTDPNSTILPQLLTLQDKLGEFQDLSTHETIIIDAIAYLRPIYAESTIFASEELVSGMKRRRRKLRKKVLDGIIRA